VHAQLWPCCSWVEGPCQVEKPLDVWAMIYRRKVSPPEVRVLVNNKTFCPTLALQGLHLTCSEAVSASSKGGSKSKGGETAGSSYT
jgi:hypothetical protein